MSVTLPVEVTQLRDERGLALKYALVMCHGTTLVQEPPDPKHTWLCVAETELVASHR